MGNMGNFPKRKYTEKLLWDFLNKRISECAGFTMELVQGRMYKDRKDREIEQLKKDLSNLWKSTDPKKWLWRSGKKRCAGEYKKILPEKIDERRRKHSYEFL